MTEYEDQIRKAWASREARLTSETGWLTVVGRHTLEPGPNELEIGTVVLDGDVVRLGERILRPDDPRDAVLFGGQRWELVLRGGTYALRVRDPESALRREFHGIPRWPIDPAWRLEARLERFDAPRTMEVPRSMGGVEPYESPGVLCFEVGGRTFGLEPGRLDDGRLMILFADETSRTRTYSTGRFLYAPPLEANRAILDFNLAMNPPCAFTPFVTCPLAPPQNRLAIAVTAGEMRPDSSDRAPAG